MSRLPSDSLTNKGLHPVVVTLLAVAISGGVVALGIGLGGLVSSPNPTSSPTPIATTSAVPREIADVPSPTPTPTETTAPAPTQDQPPALQPAPKPAPAPQPVKCPPGTDPGAVDGNGNESNCAPPCQAYDDNNVCINPGSLTYVVREPELVSA